MQARPAKRKQLPLALGSVPVRCERWESSIRGQTACPPACFRLLPPLLTVACFNSSLQGSSASGGQQVGAWVGGGRRQGGTPNLPCLASKAKANSGSDGFRVQQREWQGAVGPLHGWAYHPASATFERLDLQARQAGGWGSHPRSMRLASSFPYWTHALCMGPL